jgi:DNA repair exonuclease SbcCD ATPase subunit
MSIHFNWLELEGFRSWVNPFHFDLDRGGLNLFNGAGKTSLFEGIVFALFGENLKEEKLEDLPSWPEIRTSQWQGTRVSVCFSTDFDTYMVHRHLGYKGLTDDVRGEDYLMLYKGDDDRGHKPVQVGNFRNKTEIQEEINRILGMDCRTFMNSILFGQRMAKLIQQDNKDKRELFETLFETEWVSAAKIKCDKDISKFESEMSNIDTNTQISQSKIDSLNAQLEQIKQIVENFEENRANRILTKQSELDQYSIQLAQCTTSIIQYNKELKTIKYDAERHDQLDQDFKEYTRLFNEANVSMAKRTAERAGLESKVKDQQRIVTQAESKLKVLKDKHIEENCPYCEQELRAGNKLELNHKVEIKKAEAELKEDKKLLEEAKTGLLSYKTEPEIVFDQLNTKIQAIESEIVVLDEQYNNYEAANHRIETTNDKATQAKKDILRTNNEIDAINAEKAPQANNDIEKNIILEQDKLKKSQHNKLEVEKKLGIAKWWSSKGFSSSGIKAYIFTSMLSQLNQNVKKYGQRLGVSLEFSIDLTKASKPFTTRCSLGDKLNKKYSSFSGGEKQKLDIVLLFGMHDLISINASTNLLIMDEVFEGLSEDGETAVFDLIRTKADEGKSVYIITHSAVLDSLYANTLEFQNINGITHLIN